MGASSKYVASNEQVQMTFGDDDSSGKRTKKCVLMFLGVLLILAAIIGVIVYFAEFHGKTTDSQSGSGGQSGGVKTTATKSSTAPTTKKPTEVTTKITQGKTTVSNQTITANQTGSSPTSTGSTVKATSYSSATTSIQSSTAAATTDPPIVTTKVSQGKTSVSDQTTTASQTASSPSSTGSTVKAASDNPATTSIQETTSPNASTDMTSTTSSQVPTTSTTTPTPIFTVMAVEEDSRVDCLPDFNNKSQSVCESRGCAWSSSASDITSQCYTNFADRGYTFSQISSSYYSSATAETQLVLEWNGTSRGLFTDEIIPKVKVIIQERDNNTLRIAFKDADKKRYEVPLGIQPSADLTTDPKYNYTFSQDNSGKFYIYVQRKEDGTVIFDTRGFDLIMEEQFLSLTTRVPTKNVFGFGENVHKTFRHQFNKTETYGLFARDQPPQSVYQNLYGVHPFYTCIENSGNAHGVFLLNSNAQDYTLKPGGVITYRTIGGILDFYIFTGPSPKAVVQQYTELVGRPYLPPYWSLGFQICRYGYRDTEDVKKVVERTRAAGIPHDVQYLDIDYMNGRKDFTLNDSFSDAPAYLNDLRANRTMKTIIILDPALSTADNYSIYNESKDSNIYIKWPQDNSSAICDQCADDQGNMLGYVWPDNKTVFPDFFRNNTSELWIKWVVDERVNRVPFDGLWIDMNEPANFDTNKDKPWNWDVQTNNASAWNLKCDMSNKFEKPPYLTKAAYHWNASISDKTLCMVAVQGESGQYKHYDVHNLYGWSQSEPSLRAMRAALRAANETEYEQRGMVISRSTFPGSGKWVGHWLGDNTARWEDLRYSIIGMLEFNLFGIPYVGADICGFFEDTNLQLCTRWMQLGAFYPFSRNHNGIFWVDHDPAAFNDSNIENLSRTSLETRYKLLPYLYSLFYQVNLGRDNLVVNSLQFEWPRDEKTYDISEQFLWGDAILFSPILYENQTELRGYLPAGEVWYDYYTGMAANCTELSIDVQNETDIPIHIRGGKIIPMKEAALTTTLSRRTNFSLLVPLDANRTADGMLFWDLGDELSNETFCEVVFEFKGGQNYTLNADVRSSSCVDAVKKADGNDSVLIEEISILGFPNVTILNSAPNSTWSYNVTTQRLDIKFDSQQSVFDDSFNLVLFT